MYKNILLAVDLNHDSSWKVALPTAMEMSRGGGGTLHLLGIAPDFGMALVSGFFPENFERKALDHLDRKLEGFAKEHIDEDLDYQVHVGHGAIASEIIRVAEELAVDLIVMASHSPEEVRDFLIGSNADRVVRHSPISVLVVRA